MKKVSVVVESHFIHKCNYCGAKFSGFLVYCDKCKSLNYTGGMDYFKIFALPTSFDIDGSELQKKYLLLQSLIHPDRFINKSDEQKLLSIKLSSVINDGYNILKDFRLRGQYILSLNGIYVNSDKDNIKPDQNLLSWVFKTRLSIDEANNIDDLTNIQENVQSNITISKNSILKFFSNEELQFAAQEIISLRYQEKILEEVKEKIKSDK